MLTSGCGHNSTDSHDLIFVSVLRLGGNSPSTEERFHRLSVLGAHAVVDEDVEGGIDVGGNFKEPEHSEERVLVATARVHLWHKG